jgi:AbiV family abortive infection protein
MELNKIGVRFPKSIPVNLKKFRRMEELTFINGLRLHNDSIMLYKNSSFPSAFQLSVLSLEEFGKVSLINSYIADIEMYNETSFVNHKKFIHSLYNHSPKQKIFARDLLFAFPKNFLKSVNGNRLDNLKQSSTYVGFQNRKNNNSRLITPLSTSSERVRKQVTILNDYLIVLTHATIKKFYHWDSQNILNLFTQELLAQLKANWKYRGTKMNSSILLINKYSRK